ncbi:MAG: diacylglycerol kinase [Candidatus Omnitrophica bacterium]|nr:diacylglycerol kinase [Candidatus Omnitrophota bacterium]
MSFFKRSKDPDKKGFIYSVNFALEGVVHTLRSERNMRVHFLLGFLALIAGVYFNLPAVEFMLLCFAVSFVLVSEMFNTAIEHVVDLVSEEYHPLAKLTKDIAAGAVFVSAVNAVIVGYMLVVKRADIIMDKAFFAVKKSSWHITLIALLVVVGIVLLVKVVRREEKLLRGGMPSGHTAVAFAIWSVISLLTMNVLVSILVLFLAILVARSRMIGGVHKLWEVIAGAILGALTALVIFQLLS